MPGDSTSSVPGPPLADGRTFRYKPLEHGSFRFLLLEADGFEDDLGCAIVYSALRQDSEYTALAYLMECRTGY